MAANEPNKPALLALVCMGAAACMGCASSSVMLFSSMKSIWASVRSSRLEGAGASAAAPLQQTWATAVASQEARLPFGGGQLLQAGAPVAAAAEKCMKHAL